jgi:hypothetical protein
VMGCDGQPVWFPALNGGQQPLFRSHGHVRAFAGPTSMARGSKYVAFYVMEAALGDKPGIVAQGLLFSLAVGGAAEEHRQLVSHQLAAAPSENRRTLGQARPLVLAVGRGSSDAAALWSQAGQDCGATISSGIGGPQTGADFGDEGDRGRKSVGGIGRGNGTFGLWHCQEGQDWPLEAPSAENPTGHCSEKPLGVCYRSTANS